MPYLRGKLKGQLKAPEIRKIVKLHNELSKIKIPPKLDRDALIKFIESKGYMIDHEKQMIVMTKTAKKDFTLSEAEEQFPKASKPKKIVVQSTKASPKEDEVRPIDKDVPKITPRLEDKPKGKVVKKATSIKVKVTKPKAVVSKAVAPKVVAPDKKIFIVELKKLVDAVKPGSEWQKKMTAAKTLNEIKELMNVYTKLSTPVDELINTDAEEKKFESFDSKVRGFRDKLVEKIKSKK